MRGRGRAVAVAVAVAMAVAGRVVGIAGWPAGRLAVAGGRVCRWWLGVRVAGWPWLVAGGRAVAGWPGGQVAGWPGGQVAGWPGGRVGGRVAGWVAGWPRPWRLFAIRLHAKQLVFSCISGDLPIQISANYTRRPGAKQQACAAKDEQVA